MNAHAVHNPTLWYGYTPCCGVVINAMSCTVPALWRGNKWAMMGATPQQCYPRPRGCGCDKWAMIRQPHRGCTFDSPGLPTIGGYPGEQGGRMLPPWGLYFLSICALHATKTHCVAAKARASSRTMEGVTANNGGYDGERWRI